MEYAHGTDTSQRIKRGQGESSAVQCTIQVGGQGGVKERKGEESAT